MRFVFFCHSLVSDWNHGNAHFLRGVVSELDARGHDVAVLEPAGGWSLSRLLEDVGPSAIDAFTRAFPTLRSESYDLGALDLDQTLAGADVVIAHEWNSPDLLRRLTRHRRVHGSYHLLFHDTHHRAVSDPDALAAFPIDGFDGVLVYGASLRDQYQRLGWNRRVWTWHEAADTRVFRPFDERPMDGDVIWIGNWGDDERAAELGEFLFDPVAALRLKARIHGVRYPPDVLGRLAERGIDYGGWIANYEVPEAFARFRVTVHVPRRPYVRMLPGIPTIRPFEAMACGVPLVSAPWDDVEGLFRAGEDYIRVETGDEMTMALRELTSDTARREALAGNGLRTIRARHTCGHRVDELLAILATLNQRESARIVADAPRTTQGSASAKGTAPPPP